MNVTTLEDDLLFDIDCVYLSSVVVDWRGHGVLLFGREGYGSFQSAQGRTEGSFDEFEASINSPEMNPMEFYRLVTRLIGWRDRQTPLRVIQARGKLACMLENESIWVALPAVGK